MANIYFYGKRLLFTIVKWLKIVEIIIHWEIVKSLQPKRLFHLEYNGTYYEHWNRCNFS